MSTITKASNPKFKAGDTIAGQEEVDGEMRWFTYFVNRIIDHPVYGTMYSLDNGSGFIDGRERTDTIDAKYSL
jgi:hypothetical protein